MILADWHVHFHACFGVGRFLNAAADNFATHEKILSAEEPCEWMLWLTETSDATFFERLRDLTEQNGAGSLDGWTFESNREDCAIRCRDPRGRGITLVAGSQIITQEALEVLALGTRQRIPDGMSLDETVTRVREADALPVLPWGFGKWLGRRGSIIERQLKRADVRALFLGDNSGRAALGATPLEFSLARAAGIKILPGSDPLPFPTEYRKVGSFGFCLDADAGLDRGLVCQIKEILREPNTRVEPFGQLEKPWRFVRNQIAMQFIKRKARRRDV